MRAQRILVTGGAGFIGTNLTLRLKQDGHFVRWLDNYDPQIHGDKHPSPPIGGPDEIVVDDVRNMDAWTSALSDCDAVVHLAAQTGTAQSMYRPAYYADVNVVGTANMWDVLANDRRMRVTRVVLASSRSVYGEGAYKCHKQCGAVVPHIRTRDRLSAGQWEPTCPKCGSTVEAVATPEESPTKPASLYAASKLAQEGLSLTMGKALGVAVAVCRLQNAYGPGQSLANPYTGIISILSNQLRQHLPVNIYEDGLESRDFVFVDDVSLALQYALKWPEAMEIVNVGSGHPTTLLDLAHRLRSLWNSSSAITITRDYRVGDIRHNWADLSRFRAANPDWQPTSLNDGLRQFVDWATRQSEFVDNALSAKAELAGRNLAGTAR